MKGLRVEQIVRLSEDDNENDEYHTPVHTEVWASYKRLYDERDENNTRVWTEKRIAEAKRAHKPSNCEV